ncbi:hypothetical protein ACIRTB_21645 [Streptomyces sp. NPDC101158]|uniref:hypothetical protein n=1 Tax=Streptomyces sp. NPDC101158 TaxID=3366117 RepID=UPI00382341F1
MLRGKFQRALTALSLAVAASAVPLMTAAEAQATPADCRSYLANRGYRVGPGVVKACNYNQEIVGHPFCVGNLVRLGVNQTHAMRACDLAAWR